MRHLPWLLHLAWLALLANHAQAATDDNEAALESLLRQEVLGPSRFAQSLLDAPAAVSVLGRQEAALLGHVTVADMLERLPGIYMSSSRQYSSVGVRGFNRPGDYNARLLVAIDGFRVNDALYDQALPEFEFPLVADWVKRVELVHGPGSSVYGGNALFGVVNLVTLDGADAPGWTLKGSLGSFGERRAMLQYGSADLGGGDLFVGMNMQHARGETLELPELALPAGSLGGLDALAYSSAFLKYRLGGWRVSAASMVRSKPAATAPYGSQPGAPGTVYRDQYLYGEIAYDAAWASDWRRSLRLSLARSGFNGRYVYAADDPAQPSLINRDEAVARWLGLEARTQWRGWLNHELALGLDARLLRHGVQRNFDEQPYHLWLDSDEPMRSLGLFAQDSWRLSEQWQLSTGLRLDRVQDRAAQWSPRLALIYRPRQDESIKLMAGRAFRPANLAERFYADDVSQLAHPELAPEQLGTLELAWERALGPDLAFSLNAYVTRMRDMIEFVPLQGDAGLARYENVARVRARGLDLGLEQRHASGWQWRANLSLADARSGGEQRLSNSPRWLFKGHLIAPLRPGWTLATEWLAMGRRLGRSEVPTLFTLNAVLRYTGWRGQDLALRVLNVADRANFDPAPPDTLSTRLPRPRRSLHLDWQIRF